MNNQPNEFRILANRIRQCHAPDPQLDADIARAFGATGPVPPPYTASVRSRISAQQVLERRAKG